MLISLDLLFSTKKFITNLYSLANKLELVAEGCIIKCFLADQFLFFQEFLVDIFNYGEGLCCHTAMTFCSPAQW